MSASVIGALRVNLGLDSAQFEKGAKRSQSTLKTMRTQFAAIAGAAAAMGVAISTAALKGAQQIDAAAKSARRLDSSIGGFRALELAAEESGVSLSSLTSDLQTMNRELANIGTSGNADRALDRLGMAASDLAGVDADEKLARIADRIEALGLTSGETTAVLRDFGIRNREMVLLVGQGGDAIRNARTDIESYGLAISSVDSARIEVANDAIGRLGLIGQYAGQQLALTLVPAMGRMAEAMTDSLREGGALRGMIDGLVGNLDRMAAYVSVAVVGFGTRYVVAVAAARLATLSLSGALGVLRAALIRTGIGALIVLVGEVVLWLDRARERTGSFSAAFQQAALNVKAGALAMKAWVIDAINGMIGAFMEMTWTVADGLNGLFGTDLDGARLGETTQDLARKARAARDASADAAAAAKALNITLDDTSDSAETAAESLDRVEDAAGGAGGGMRKAKDEASDLAKELDGPVTSAVDGVAKAFGDWVANGFKDFRSFVRNVVDSFKSMISQMIATAARNRIMISLGIGGGGLAGTAASAAGGFGGIGGGGLLSNLFGGSGFLGLGGGAGSLFGGAGLLGAGGGTGLFGLGSGSGLAGALGGGAFGSLASVALPVIGIAAGLFSFFKKKKTVVDSGLKVDVAGDEIAAQQFQMINTKRFFGLSNKTRPHYSAADPAIAEAIRDVQAGVAQMAETLNIGADAFDGFTYSFNLSLKDMNADQAAQAVAAEVTKLGDAFAAMIPHIQSVSELMAVTQERYGLESRLLQLQGDTAALRARELDSVHHYNRELLQQIFALEDATAAQQELERKMADVNAQIQAFAQNSNNFVSRQEQVFAATSAGYRGQSVQVENRDLLRDLIQAIREGDINQARLTSRLVQIEERRELEPST